MSISNIDSTSANSPRTVGLSPWLTSDEAVAYLRFPSRDAFYEWRKRHRVAIVRRGARMLVLKAELDRAIGAHRG